MAAPRVSTEHCDRTAGSETAVIPTTLVQWVNICVEVSTGTQITETILYPSEK